jgi:DNA-directed RNA polymerase subunit RPC12/RpoP
MFLTTAKQGQLQPSTEDNTIQNTGNIIESTNYKKGSEDNIKKETGSKCTKCNLQRMYKEKLK